MQKENPGLPAGVQQSERHAATACSISITPRQDVAAKPAPTERKVELRAYQRDVIDRLRAATLKQRRILLVAPTGSGKTVIASAIVEGAVAKGRRVLFLAHRRELINQAAAKLWENGIDAGIILAGRAARPEQPVQVASVQTLWSRAFRGTSMEAPPADVVVVDEAHHVRARTYGDILDHYPDAVVLGLTATPCRGDGRGLGNVFETLAPRRRRRGGYEDGRSRSRALA